MMPEQISTQRRRRLRLFGRFQRLEVAEHRKFNRYVWSGFLVILVGLAMIGIGLVLHTGAYSAEGLLVGFGVIVVIVGIIRMLIGFINPLTPTDLQPVRSEEALKPVSTDLDSQIFEQPDDVVLDE
jgi:hypothetical protein